VGCRAGSVTEGRPALWSPPRVERARPFSGSQHGRCGHGRSLVPSTGGAGTAVLWFPARAERGLEEERCAAAGERRGEQCIEVLKPRSWEPNAATPDTGGLCPTVTVTH
jgi:hypothetical protein